mgnify:CR=1 FL=1
MSNSSFVESVLEQLDAVDGITTRKMFGGVGIYRYGTMFALIIEERLYFKVDASNIDDYKTAGSVPFIYDKVDKDGKKKSVTVGYWELPIDVFEDKDLIFKWMVKSHEAAVKNKHVKIT